MKLTYLEHYPHYMGTMNTRTSIDADAFLAAATAIQVLDGDDLENVLCEFEDYVGETGDEGYALMSLLLDDWNAAKTAKVKRFREMFEALDNKGYFAARWEEGSHAICRSDKVKEAIAAIAKIEADIKEDDFGMDDF